jgi:hypothetical protein
MTLLAAAPAGAESSANCPQRVESVASLAADVTSGDRSVARAGRDMSDPPIVMAPGGPCEPDWIPTFGCDPGFGLTGTVNALATFDDGSGPALIAGGDFSIAGGAWASRVARWTGAGWAPLAFGLNGTVYALAVFDEGDGPHRSLGWNELVGGGRINRWRRGQRSRRS